MRGEFLLQGFRNKDLRLHLFPEAEFHAIRRRKASDRITRCLRLLRAHGLIRKVPGTRYYRVTEIREKPLQNLATYLPSKSSALQGRVILFF